MNTNRLLAHSPGTELWPVPYARWGRVVPLCSHGSVKQQGKEVQRKKAMRVALFEGPKKDTLQVIRAFFGENNARSPNSSHLRTSRNGDTEWQKRGRCTCAHKPDKYQVYKCSNGTETGHGVIWRQDTRLCEEVTCQAAKRGRKELQRWALTRENDKKSERESSSQKGQNRRPRWKHPTRGASPAESATSYSCTAEGEGGSPSFKKKKRGGKGHNKQQR